MLGTGTPKDRDEVQRLRDERFESVMSECECDLQTIGVLSIVKVTRSSAVLPG